ncbi:MAG: gamma-glutamyltransferase [Roseovarius sp.]|nr:gamma-glutamyltransferase [Roseovarius sp.]
MRDYQMPGRSTVLALNGMCATSHPLATQTAIDILARGGNAMDAAVAGAVLLGICEPQMTGIGGDCFALFTKPGGSTIHALNGSGRAPAKASAGDLRDRGHATVPVYSPDAVTIPGAIDAFCRMSEEHGKLGLDALLAPAIRHAEDGVPVSPRVAHDWKRAGETLSGHGRDFFMNDGKPFKTGEIFRAPAQAEVLRRIAANGRTAFYEGEIAEDMVATLNKLGGSHTTGDFAAAACEETAPIRGRYQDIELVEHPPNGQGATAILMLNILSHFDIANMDPLGSPRAHIEAEAAKLAYDARNRIIADPNHTARLEFMLSRETAKKLANLIDTGTAMPETVPLAEAIHRDTIYITVVDRDRMAVSLIYSIYHGFGSGIASKKFGILLHNRGAGFCLEESHPNELNGGKRPMHTIIPAMLCDKGIPVMSFGVMGGAYQPNGHARLVSNLRDFGMDPQSAIDAPRSFSDTGQMKVERGYSDTVRQELADLGHNVGIPDEPIGGAQVIHMRPDGVLEGASDPRKDGCALGY